MNEHRPIVPALHGETLSTMERAASRRGTSVEQYMTEAIHRVAESDDDFDAFIQVGIDQVDRGEPIPHDQVMAESDAMVARHRARTTE